VGPERVVVGTPSFDDHLRLTEDGEDLSTKDFVSELRDDPLNTVSLASHPDLPLRSGYWHTLTQNLDHFLGAGHQLFP
jgi:hypothetical protein